MTNKEPKRRGKRSRTLKTGDVFAFPAPDGRRGIGQIARSGIVMWIVIFRDLFDELPTPEGLYERDILLSAWTTDALFFHERWTVFGNYPVADDRIPHPSYVVQQDGQFFVESFDGGEFRPASQHDVNRLRYRFDVGPIRFQEALLAHHGFGNWKPHYDEITVETARKWTPI